MESVFLWIAANRWRGITGGMLLASGMVLVGEVVPRWIEVGAQYQAVQTDRARIAEVVTWEREKVRIVQHRRMLRERYDHLYVSLPHIDQISVIVRTLQQHADSAGGVLTHIRPGERLQYANFDALPLEVELDGTFHSITTFVKQVESAQYLVKVNAITLSAPTHWPGPVHAVIMIHLILLKEET